LLAVSVGLGSADALVTACSGERWWYGTRFGCISRSGDVSESDEKERPVAVGIDGSASRSGESSEGDDLLVLDRKPAWKREGRPALRFRDDSGGAGSGDEPSSIGI
jgi:hypothetical protein